MEPHLRTLIPNISALARAVSVSDTTVSRWIEVNAVPPAQALNVAQALSISARQILPYVRRATVPTVTAPKTGADLEALYKAYRGEPYETTLPPHAIRKALESWGNRVPLLYHTLKNLHERKISLSGAAEALGITIYSVNNLRKRYGLAPGRLKKSPKTLAQEVGRNMQIAEKIPDVVYDVISGRKTAEAAAQASGINLRTLHRHIKRALEGITTTEFSEDGSEQPLMVKKLAHWSPAFRCALAAEMEKNLPKTVISMRKWAKDRGIVLKKAQKRLKPVENYRRVSTDRAMIDWLFGDLSVEEIAALRGGEAHIIESSFHDRLAAEGFHDLPTSHHRAALAEILTAQAGHYRRPA